MLYVVVAFFNVLFLFFLAFSIWEMELFAQWSAKVWALWIVIIQLATTSGDSSIWVTTTGASLSSTSLRFPFLSVFVEWVVRIVRIMWMSFFFTSVAHKKSQQPSPATTLHHTYHFKPIHVVLRREKLHKCYNRFRTLHEHRTLLVCHIRLV